MAVLWTDEGEPMSAEETKVTRTRKPAPRVSQIIWGAIYERLDMLMTSPVDAIYDHVKRLNELHDELQRSLRKDNGSE
jgi:hypothetical protein